MNIQERILELLKKRDWSLYKLAKEAGIHETTVYDWFNDNHYTPSRKSLEDVCAALEISPAEFYTDIEVDKLTERELKILELFRKVPEEKKDTVITLVEAFTK